MLRRSPRSSTVVHSLGSRLAKPDLSTQYCPPAGGREVRSVLGSFEKPWEALGEIGKPWEALKKGGKTNPQTSPNLLKSPKLPSTVLPAHAAKAASAAIYHLARACGNHTLEHKKSTAFLQCFFIAEFILLRIQTRLICHISTPDAGWKAKAQKMARMCAL